jgi:hypothetical protein
MGVLEPFIRDPTVSWGRSGRAQREENSSKGPMKAIQDTDNRDAKEALLKITERLNGIYNLCHPSGKKRAIQVYRRAFLSSSLLLPYTSFSLAHTKHIFFLPYMKNTHTHTHTHTLSPLCTYSFSLTRTHSHPNMQAMTSSRRITRSSSHHPLKARTAPTVRTICITQAIYKAQ